MAFLMEDVLLYQDNCLLSDQEVCSHYILEGAAETYWFMRLEEVVERSVDKYTTAYPCMNVDREQAHIVPQLYQRCPHCQDHTAKTNHITQLVTDLAKTLVGSNVLEVQADSGARTPFMPGILSIWGWERFTKSVYRVGA